MLSSVLALLAPLLVRLLLQHAGTAAEFVGAIGIRSKEPKDCSQVDEVAGTTRVAWQAGEVAEFVRTLVV